MDSIRAKLSTDRPTVFITASYEGQPPDNAALFVDWLENIKDDTALRGVFYAVFGCGHHDWPSTFHRIPKLVDSSLEKCGGSRIAHIGLADAADGDVFSTFEAWEDTVLWPALREKYGIESTQAAYTDGQTIPLSIQITNPRLENLRQNLEKGRVLDCGILTAEGEPMKRYIEIQLPENMAYTAGDYLAVLPLNPKEEVRRAMRQFDLPWDAHVTINGSNAKTYLPTDVAVAVTDIFSSYVELARPATKRNILSLGKNAKSESTKVRLQTLAADAHASEVVTKNISILDLLESYPDITLSLSDFLSMLPPLRTRQYSIASSPLWDSTHVVLAFSVIDAPSFYNAAKRHVGIATTYLSSLLRDDLLYVSVRPSHAAFRLPINSEETPVLMVAAGTGLAPFRGFIQERAVMLTAGRKLAPAVLFLGCRELNKDTIFREQLKEWEGQGAVTVRWAYSRKSEESGGCKYVQDRLWKDRNEVVKMWNNGAKLYVCGSRSVADAVKDVFISIFVDADSGSQMTKEEARLWFEGIRNVRYVLDIFDLVY